MCAEGWADALQGRRFVTYPTEFVKTRSQFGGKVRARFPALRLVLTQ